MKSKIFLCKIILICSLKIITTTANAQIPNINSVSPLNVCIGSLVHIKGTNMNFSASVSFNNTNALIISITDTEVVAMVMPGTVTGFDIKIIATGGGQTIFADEIFVHPSKPPVKQLGNKLFDNTVVGDPQEGTSVAISADGNTAVVGGQNANSNSGAVWVYTRTNNVWSQQGNKLIGTGGVGNNFQGFSVSISADGNTIIEGGIGDNGFSGASWIFVRDTNGQWSQQGNKLVGSNSIIIQSTTPEQGFAVGLSADGNTAIIGGRRDSSYIGAAWIFTRTNNVWSEQQKLVGAGHQAIVNIQGTNVFHGVDMGYSVALSADGNTAFIGGPNDDNDTGAVWVFVRNANLWTQQGNKLVGSGSNASFTGGILQGSSVATSADGNTVIYGAPTDLDSAYASSGGPVNIYNGAAWVFTRNGNTWSQQGNKLFASDAAQGAQQGWSVGMSADGNTAIVGAPVDSVDVGGSWIFTRANNVWQQSSNKLLGTNYLAGPKQGASVAISSDGNTAIVGGPENNPLGAAWVFADTTAVILPVTFANFSAIPLDKGVQISWSGFEEINLDRYEVERSGMNNQFRSLAKVEVKLNNATKNNYEWFDANPLTGNNFYRIKAINLDESFQYSSVIRINWLTQSSILKVYPNPTFDKIIHLHIDNVVSDKYVLTVFNTIGEKVFSQHIQQSSGSSSLAIDLNNSTTGLYHIELRGRVNTYRTTVLVH